MHGNNVGVAQEKEQTSLIQPTCPDRTNSHMTAANHIQCQKKDKLKNDRSLLSE